MTCEAYKQALHQAKVDLYKAIRERDRLNLEIVKLQQLVKSLAEMTASNTKDEEQFKALEYDLGFTDIVHTLIRNSKVPMSALSIRDEMKGLGYDLSGYSNPVGFIHTVLARLQTQKKIRKTATGYFVASSPLFDVLLALGLPDANLPLGMVPSFSTEDSKKKK